METKIKLETKWLSNLGLIVKESKLEVKIFDKGETHPITIDLNGNTIVSSNYILTALSNQLPAQVYT